MSNEASRGAAVSQVSGRAIPLTGNDIDTDRIIPARFLKAITFEGLGENAFADERASAKAEGRVHPLDDPRFAGGAVLLVNKNFGCGSSREHAPQALRRYGIRAVVGESFGEIFAGNCIAVGMPCVTVSAEAMGALQDVAAAETGSECSVNLETKTITFANQQFPCEINEGARRQFVEGRWDATDVLMQAGDAIGKTAEKVPYFGGWA
ncbi:MAG: 3-isopropylmalate dehydratase small subunit [Alphaproteobacteria bacterium]